MKPRASENKGTRELMDDFQEIKGAQFRGVFLTMRKLHPPDPLVRGAAGGSMLHVSAIKAVRLYIKKFYKAIYSPLTLKCAQEFVWVTFYSYSVLTNKTKYLFIFD